MRVHAQTLSGMLRALPGWRPWDSLKWRQAPRPVERLVSKMSSCSRQGDTVPNSPDMAGGSRVQHPWVNPGGTSQGPNDRFLVLQVPHPIRHSLRWLSKDTVPQSMSTPQPLPIRARSFNETSWPGLLRASKSPGHSQTHPLHPQRQQRDTGSGDRQAVKTRRDPQGRVRTDPPSEPTHAERHPHSAR